MNKIRKAFFLSEALRESAKLTLEGQAQLIEWFIAYEDKNENEMQDMRLLE